MKKSCVCLWISIVLILFSGLLLGCGVGELVSILTGKQLHCFIMIISMASSLGIIARIVYIEYKNKLIEEKMDKLNI